MKVNINGNLFYKPGDNYTFMECAFLYIRRCALKKKRSVVPFSYMILDF